MPAILGLAQIKDALKGLAVVTAMGQEFVAYIPWPYRWLSGLGMHGYFETSAVIR